MGKFVGRTVNQMVVTEQAAVVRKKRPAWDAHFMNLAHISSERSSCSRRQVGTILVRDKIILMSSYNGTPRGVTNCDEGGCPRCASDEPSLSGYGWCTCVHAEINAVALAAHEGITTRGATLYCTLRPCLDCLKGVIQAGVREVVFNKTFDYPDHVEVAYRNLLFQGGVVYRQYELP